MNITQAIYDKLAGDSILTGLLATYGSDSPPAPAIFTMFPVPPDAARPYIFTEGEDAVGNFDELAGDLGLDVIRSVAAYADNTGSALPIEAIARRIRTVLHRQSLVIPNGSHVQTICVSGPVVAPTDDTLVGRLLSFRIVAMET